jgi:hypothetical protein
MNPAAVACFKRLEQAAYKERAFAALAFDAGAG